MRDEKRLEEIYRRERPADVAVEQVMALRPSGELLDLKGRAAIVTAAGGVGLGRASAIKLAQLGATVAVADIDGDGAERNAVWIRDEVGADAAAFQADVSKPESVGGGLSLST